MAAVRAAALAMMALRAMSVVPSEARPMAVAIVAVRATMLTTLAAVAAAVAMTMAAVTSAAAAAIVTVEARAMAMAVMFCDAILPWYADVVNVKSDNDGNHAPAFDGGNIDRGVADFDNCMWHACGGQQQWWGECGNTGGKGGSGGSGRKRRHGGTGWGE